MDGYDLAGLLKREESVILICHHEGEKAAARFRQRISSQWHKRPEGP
jgi:hypothetical protein